MRLIAFWLLCLGFLLRAAPAVALTPEEAITRFFTVQELQEEWFSRDFLVAFPLEKIQALRNELVEEYGEFREVTSEREQWRVRLADAFVPTRIALDFEDRIAVFWLGVPLPLDGTLSDVTAEIAKLPGEVSLLVRREGEVLAAEAPDEPLAVGSAFKLAVLAALVRQIDEGERAWDDVVRLDRWHRSLPSGLLQDWPRDAPLTLHSLASLMLSLSDNTATDALIALLGREAVEAELPAEARPLLTTREYFVLAAGDQGEARQRFLAGDETARRAVLQEIEGIEPRMNAYLAGGVGPDLGWHLSAETLYARLLAVLPRE